MTQYLARMPDHFAVTYADAPHTTPMASSSTLPFMIPATNPLKPSTASGSMTNTTTIHSTIGGSRG